MALRYVAGKLKPDVDLAVLGKVIQSNARFGLSDLSKCIWIM